MIISAPDLDRWMMMHMKLGRGIGRRIIKKNSALLMQEPYDAKEKYGLAISTTEKLIPGIILKGHTGSAYGLNSAMYFHPKEKYGFVVITNGCLPGYTDGYNTVIRKTVNCLYEYFIAGK